MSKITGKELMERWNMEGYHILQVMENDGLRISGGTFDDEVIVERLLMPGKVPYDLEDTIASLQFALSDIEAIENKRNLLSGKLSTVDQNKVFPCKPGAKWEDIKITLTADDMVKIKTPQGEGIFSYHQLGMSNKNTREQSPTVLWAFVKILSKNDGFISSENPDYNPKLPEVAKRLNKHLKQLFGIDESIYQGHYKKMKGYKTKIFFSDRTKVVS